MPEVHIPVLQWHELVELESVQFEVALPNGSLILQKVPWLRGSIDGLLLITRL